MSKEDEYKEMFLAEAGENHEELNRLLTTLEKKPEDKSSIDAIFRITHTLKGNAAGMGFTNVSKLAHVMEDLFGEVREGALTLDSAIFTTLFKAVDKLGELIEAVKTDKKVQFRGIVTKLEVMLKNSRAGREAAAEEPTPAEAPAEDTPEATEEKKPKKVARSKAKAKKAPVAKPKPEPVEDEQEEEIQEQEATKITFSDLVQVPVKKLDNLLNLVGELVIERDRLIAAHGSQLPSNEYARLNRVSSDLQYSVMDVRLVQVGFLFNKFHRVVRDAAAIEQKEVSLVLNGTETEIDRNILQIISDSLIHLIRNAIGHGIESPEERKNAGKDAEGTITLSARSESDAVIIEIQDDGCGINVDRVRQKAINRGLISKEDADSMSDNDAALLIFEPGLSTMDAVTAISGRGVGMDVVKKALDSIGGNVAVHTEPGVGTIFSLSLPSSMAVKGTLLFELDAETYAIPLSHTEAVVSLYKTEIHKLNGSLMASYSGTTISLIFLKDLFLLKAGESLQHNKILQQSFDQLHPEDKLDVVIVSYGTRKVGFVVDKLLQQKEIVEKPLMKPMDRVKLISGVTIMGNGHVCLVLNVVAICNMLFSRNFSQNKLSNQNS